MGGVKDRIMILFKTTTTKDYSKPTSVRWCMVWWCKKNKEFKIKKQSEDTIIKNVRNLFRLKKENEAIKDRKISIKDLFEQEEDFYKPLSVGNFYSNNYIEYESNGDRNKTLLIKQYLDEIKPCLKDIDNIKKSDTWKIQLIVAIEQMKSVECIQRVIT